MMQIQNSEALHFEELHMGGFDGIELDGDQLDQVAGAGIWAWIAVRVAAKLIIYAGDKIYDAVTD